MKVDLKLNAAHDAYPGVRPFGNQVLLYLPATVFLLVLAVAPTVLTFVISFWKASVFGLRPDFDPGNYLRILDEPIFRDLFLRTLWVAVATTVLCLVISFPLAWFLVTRPASRKPFWLVALFVPFWISYVVRTYAWLPILGMNGLINNLLLALGVVDAPLDWLLYRRWTVYLGLVYVYLLFMTLPIYLSLEKLDPRLLIAASDLGASPRQVLLRVVLPLTRPAMLSGSLMVFLLSISAYVTPRLLGGGEGLMLGAIIADQFLTSNNWAFGAALASALMAVIAVVLYLLSRFTNLMSLLVPESR